MLSLPSCASQDPCTRAKQAERRLRAALKRVDAERLSRQQPPMQVTTTTTQKTEGEEEPLSSSPPLDDVPSEAPHRIVMEWPLSPLSQRVKEKKARDLQRQRRRATRQAAADAAAAASMSAADKMRHTLSQPLGVMAAKLLSAATAGAPSLFSDSGAEEPTAATVTRRGRHSPTPPYVSNLPTMTTTASPRGAAASPPAVGAAGARAPPAHTPSPSGSPHALRTTASTSIYADPLHRASHYSSHSHHHHSHARPANYYRHHYQHHHHAGSPSPSPLHSLTHYGGAEAALHTSLRASSVKSSSPPPESSATGGDARARDAAPLLCSTNSRSKNHDADTSNSLLTLRVNASPARVRRRHKHHTRHCRHARLVSKPIAVTSAAAAHDALLSSSSRTRATPTSAVSPTHAFFRKSPISILARTFGGAASSSSTGGVGFGGSPTLESDRLQRQKATAASAFTKTPDTLNASVSAGAVGGAGGGGAGLFSSSLSSTGQLPAFAATTQQQQQLLQQQQPRSNSAASQSYSCSCSTCSGEWCGSSWSSSVSDENRRNEDGHNEDVFTSTASSASSDPYYYPMTAPGPDGRYHPRAPLPSLLRCYGDAATLHCFDVVSSTSTQHTESRTSTPFSSEWSVDSSSAHVNEEASTPTPPPTLSARTNAGSGGNGRSDSATGTSEEAAGRHGAASSLSPHNRHSHHLSRESSAVKPYTSPRGTRNGPSSAHHHHRRQSSVHSPNLPTQLSFAAEMDAIEKGQVAPYVSYLFAPEARVVELRQLEGQLLLQQQQEQQQLSELPRQQQQPQQVAATCIRFCPAGDAYLVGTSTGLLWRVPVGSGQEAVRATPLGSLWPPSAPGHGSRAGGGAGSAPSLNAMGNPSGGGGDGVRPAPVTTASPYREREGLGCGGSRAETYHASSPPLSVGSPGVPSASPATQPIPLAGHTAAILSIAFNDDGALFATTGLDGCIIVWKASTSAKLRRISAVWASASAQRAPHLVRFMPQNNNYLLVSYLDSSELHLYNSSTGLPVTNVAGTGLSRLTMSGGGAGGTVGVKNIVKSNGGKTTSSFTSNNSNRGSSYGGNSSNSRGAAGIGTGAITALAVSLIASPFFVAGDADGTVVLWTYRAGELVTWPTLRATTPAAVGGASTSGGGGGRHARSRSSVVDFLGCSGNSGRDETGGLCSSSGGAAFATPLYQLPELRRVAACALPASAGGVAALSVSTLHAPQLRSLFRPCGPQYGAAATATATQEEEKKNSESSLPSTQPHHPLEATAQLFHTAAAQNRACREELEAQQAAAEEAAATSSARGGSGTASRSRREGHAKTQSTTLRRETSEVTAPTSSSSSSFPHVLAALPSRLSDTFSALWGGGGGGGHRNETVTAPSKHASALFSPKSATAAGAANSSAAGSGSANPAAMTEKEMLRQLRSDAMEVVCPLLVLVTAPCDTVYSLGLLLQLQHGTAGHGDSNSTSNADRSSHSHRSSSSSTNPNHNTAAKPTVSYRLYPLLKTTGPSRMRHVGVGAVPSPDNYRLVVVAAPCEEGFVRVLPLLRLEPTAAALPAAAAASTAVRAGVNEAARVNRKHVLATLPMPYGGRCTGVAWSPSGRFLVAITAEGVIYEWSRVYLLSTTTAAATSHNSSPGIRRAVLRGAKAELAGVANRGGSSHTGDFPATAQGTVGTINDTTDQNTAQKRKAHKVSAGVEALRRRGCDTEYSDTVQQRPASTLHFASLLSAAAAAVGTGKATTTTVATATTAPAAAAAVARESDAARAAFSEEDAWRESLQRELERQRREQAALKLVTHPGDGGDDEVSSSGYWLDENANSKGSLDTFEEDEETQHDDDASSL